MVYLVGATCRLKTYLYHCGWHFKYRLFERVGRRLIDSFEDNINDFSEDSDGAWREGIFRRLETYLKLTQAYDVTAKKKKDIITQTNFTMWSDDGLDESSSDDDNIEEEEEVVDSDEDCDYRIRKEIRSISPSQKVVRNDLDDSESDFESS